MTPKLKVKLVLQLREQGLNRTEMLHQGIFQERTSMKFSLLLKRKVLHINL